MSRAAVSDATTQPRSSRPSDNGRTPCGSRAAYRVFSSMNVRQNAPRTVGSSSSAACSRLESAEPCANNAPNMSESVVAAPGARVLTSPAARARVTSSALFTMFAVVAQCHPGASGCVAEYRLRVLPRGLAGGGVTAVPDGDVAFHGRQRLLLENLAD